MSETDAHPIVTAALELLRELPRDPAAITIDHVARLQPLAAAIALDAVAVREAWTELTRRTALMDPDELEQERDSIETLQRGLASAGALVDAYTNFAAGALGIEIAERDTDD